MDASLTNSYSERKSWVRHKKHCWSKLERERQFSFLQVQCCSSCTSSGQVFRCLCILGDPWVNNRDHAKKTARFTLCLPKYSHLGLRGWCLCWDIHWNEVVFFRQKQFFFRVVVAKYNSVPCIIPLCNKLALVSLQVFFGVLFAAMQLGQAGPNLEAIAAAKGAAYKVFLIIDRVTRNYLLMMI